MELWELPLALQVSLATGYLGYSVAYAGLRRGHGAIEPTFLSFVFGAPTAIMAATAPTSPLAVTASFGAAMTLGAALIWRHWGRMAWVELTRGLGLNAEDGLTNAWDGVLARQGLNIDQMSVHTADGRILYLSDKRGLRGKPFDGLYLGADGSVLMAVQKERLPDGSLQERTDLSDPEWGTRLTYIPADQVLRINARF